MMSKIIDFCHLHCHSEYSVLDGLPKVEDYILRSVELGFPALALTEHGNLRSMVQLFDKCEGGFIHGGKKMDFKPIKPIVGCEFYMSPNDYRSRGLTDVVKNKIKRKSTSAKDLKELTKKYEDKYLIRKRWHVLVFAKNKKGLENVLTLNYLSWKNGFYYRPRIDMRLLNKYSEGLIVTTSCVNGVVPDLILQDRIPDAIKLLKNMRKIFGDDLYLEIQPHNIDMQKIVNSGLNLLKDESKFKLVATNDCHYVNKNDYKAHDMLLDINSRATKFTPAQDKWRFGDTNFYMMSKDEMFKAFKRNHSKYLSNRDVKSALENTMEIVDKCNVKLKLGKKQNILPIVKLPKDMTENSLIIKLCKDGWKWREIAFRAQEYADFMKISDRESIKIYKDRLNMELKRIFKMKFSKYFLIIHDLIKWARDNEIIVGPGRGSSAGSLVCYLLGITSVDPIRYDLLFDRFLHEKRIDYPDVDMDFEDSRRMEIFDYLINKYGVNRTCVVGTIGRMKGKQALQDVSRVLGIPLWEVLEVTRHIVVRHEGDSRASQTVEDSFKEFDVNKKFDKKHPEVLPYVKKIEGKARQVGIHPAAIQIAPFKLYKYIPIEFRDIKKTNKRVLISALDWRDCQDLGLVKLDLLGLGNLTVFKYIIKMVEDRHGKKIDLESLSLENHEVLDNFTKRKFAGIFQFDSIGMKKICEDVIFNSFEDIVVMNALYRPGALRSGEAKKYIATKRGKKKVRKIHPIFDKITAKTHGIVIFQEQLMQVFMEVAGYQPSKADIVRKKVSKSSGTESIWREKEDFLDGAKKNNVPAKIAEKLFRNMSFFGSYAFNKAHAAAYSVISYWGMWLKTYYPVEFFYGLLKQERDDKRISEFIREAKSEGVNVMMPDINLSKKEFTVVDDKSISVGLIDIKGVGEKACESIEANQPYKSIADFSERIDRRKVHRGVVESLIKVGAFKSIYSNTGALLSEYEDELLYKHMLELDENKGNALYKKYNKKENKLSEENEQRMIASVSPLPPDKHEIEYYKFIDRFIPKTYNFIKVKDVNELMESGEMRFVMKGIIVDVKYNRVGDFAKDDLSSKVKKRMQFGKRYVEMNIDDGTEIRRIKVDVDVFSTFRKIIDKKEGTPVIVCCTAFKRLKSVSVNMLADLDSIRKKYEKYYKTEGLIKFYLRLNRYEKYFFKHPVTFVKNRKFKLNKTIDKQGVYEVIAYISKIKYHWTKYDKKMAFIDIEDETIRIGLTVWNDVLQKANKELQIGNIVRLKMQHKENGFFISPTSKVRLINNYCKFIK
jgi:DNA polymerase-3 subunit alpha